MWEIYGVDNGLTDPDSQTANLGAQVTINGLSENDIKKMDDKGYSFKGWKVQEDGSILQPGTLYSSYSNKTLIAEWEKVTHTLTLNKNNGEPNQKIYDLKHNITYNIRSDLGIETPTKEGHRFLGWYANSNCTGNEITSVTLTEDMTLYAKWENKKAIIECYLDSELIKTNEVNVGDSYTPSTTILQGKEGYENYILLGYKDNTDIRVNYGSSMIVPDKENIQLSAVYINSNSIKCSANITSGTGNWYNKSFYTNTTGDISVNIYSENNNGDPTITSRKVDESYNSVNTYKISGTGEKKTQIDAKMKLTYEGVSRTISETFYIVSDHIAPTVTAVARKTYTAVATLGRDKFAVAKVGDEASGIEKVEVKNASGLSNTMDDISIIALVSLSVYNKMKNDGYNYYYRYLNTENSTSVISVRVIDRAGNASDWISE